MKKFFLMACMALAIVTNVAAQRYIGSKTDLETFRNDVNNGTTFSGQTVILTADIDLGGASWTPIANTTNQDGNGFRGTFDGQGHTISNFKCAIEASGTDKNALAGLFGLNRGTIKNLKVTGADCDANAKGGKMNSSAAGAIAGVNNEGTISNCTVTSSDIYAYIYYGYVGGYSHAGGIVGAQIEGTVKDCYIYNCKVTAEKRKVTWGSNEARQNTVANKWETRDATITNCCTSTSDYNSSWRMARVNAAVAFVNNFGGAAVEPYYWDANGITPHIPYAFRVDAANARTAATYATVLGDTYPHNGATYNLYPAGHVIDVTVYPQGVATDNADAGYQLANNGRAKIDAFVDDFANNSNGRYYRSQTAKVTLPTTHTADATVLSLEHTGLYGVSLENPAENVSNTLLADFDKSAAQVFNGAYFYNAGIQIPVTVYPLGMHVNGEDDGYLLRNADALEAERTDLTTIDGERYVRQYNFNHMVSSGKNTIKYELEESGYYRLTFADHGEDPAVRYDATILTEPIMVFSPEGAEFPMYRGGEKVTLEFYLEGFNGSWSDSGYFVNTIFNTTDSQAIQATPIAMYGDDGYDKDGNATYDENTDRFMRTIVYEVEMPANVTAIAYTTYSEIPTSVEGVANEAMRVYGTRGELVANCNTPAQLTVVSIDGRVVYNAIVEGETRVALPAGIYIANNNKVVVR